MMLFVGIDPGKTGAIAVLDGDGHEVGLWDMPFVGADTDVQLLETCLDVGDATLRVALEQQHAFPGQGVSSTASLMEHYGVLKGWLAAHRIPTVVVSAVRWKPAMGVPRGSEKEKSRELARRLFPASSLNRKRDHGRADALLIAEWLRRQG